MKTILTFSITKSIAAIAWLFLLNTFAASSLDAADLPQFIVPGHEAEMKSLNELHALHHECVHRLHALGRLVASRDAVDG